MVKKASKLKSSEKIWWIEKCAYIFAPVLYKQLLIKKGRG
jgi:hypothetical protein